ncbi:MAG: head-tail adaptor protein [Muribaculaceae bacterium]|nr:head-tail adaptor protein [Muribaculaceae bacterium]
MKAGKLNIRIQRRRPVKRSAAGFGSGSVSYQDEGAPVWAQRVSETGRQIKEGGEVFAAYDAEFHVHYAVQIGEGWRVRECGPEGREYRVANVIVNRQRGLRTLKCKKVND